MRTLLALAVLLTALALVVAACGGDDEPSEPAGAWAGELCSEVRVWTDELTSIGRDLASPSSLSADALRRAASDVRASTETFVDELRELGAPDTDAGEEARRLLEELADAIESEKREIEDALEGASGIGGIASTVATVGSSLTTMGEQFQSTFEDLGDIDGSDELERAFRQAEACTEFMSS